MYLPGLIWGHFGYLRAGKTMEMSRKAAMLKREYGWPIVSNYNLAISDYRLRYYEELFDADVVSTVVLCLDEAQTILDSREFANQAAITRWLIWLGKLKVVLLYTSPKPGMVDKRLRELTRYISFCTLLELPQHIGGNRSSVQNYKLDMIGFAYPAGNHSFRHQPLYSLYDTYDRDTALTYKNPPKRGKRDAQPTQTALPAPERAGAAGVALPNGVLDLRGLFD